MTKEEHIENLETIGCDGWTVSTEAYKSLQWAIKALEQEPKTGHWILGVCDNCRYDWSKDALIASVPNFCPNCGTRMEGESE